MLSIRQLAQQTIATIEPQLVKEKNTQQRLALNLFTIISENEKITDKEIIDAAEILNQHVENHGQGETKKIFSKEISNFIHEANQLYANAQQNKPAANIDKQLFNLFPPRTNFDIETEDEIKKREKKRSDLENEIEDLLKKYYPTDRIFHAWHHQLQTIKNNMMFPHESAFFDNHREAIDQYPDLKNKVSDYERLINDKPYQAYLRNQSNLSARGADRGIKQWQYQIDEHEARMARVGFTPGLLSGATGKF